jgi:ribosomal protein L11 methyltransferase
MIRLAIRVARADAEVALAELLELAPGGVEEVDRGDTIEYAVYGSPGELPTLPDLRAAAGAALVDVRTTEVADDWASRWRDFHQPVTIGARLHVRPPWADPPSPRAGLLDIVIDPNQAFGTGAHDTTRLCLEALLELEPGGPLVDLGCGSGVLAIAAAKLGWAPVVGIDHEREAVAAARENAQANGVVLDIRRGDLLHGAPAPSAPTVVANLLRPLLEHVARAGFDGAPPQVLVAGGLLRAEADAIASAFDAGLGLGERARRERGEWAALTLGRAPDEPRRTSNGDGRATAGTPVDARSDPPRCCDELSASRTPGGRRRRG